MVGCYPRHLGGIQSHRDSHALGTLPAMCSTGNKCGNIHRVDSKEFALTVKDDSNLKLLEECTEYTLMLLLGATLLIVQSSARVFVVLKHFYFL